jgi:C-terminal processing protease CtpA/Prc
LVIGDTILAVNNKKTENLTHQEVVDLLRNAGQHVHLKIQYKLPTPGKQSRPALLHDVRLLERLLELIDNQHRAVVLLAWQ